MATVNVKIAVCDLCGQEAECWHFTPPDKPRIAVDLCEDHSQPLRELQETLEKRGGGKVKTMEQIEREKAAARKAAARRVRESQ